ncbi:MAG: LCP family protein [Hungatella hathewayi]|nr:LCP family protein [Hungatella hathewayi]
MSKEYDDELDRASGPNGRSRARNSEHGTSEDAYYLDDDLSTAGYSDADGDTYGRQQTGRPMGRPSESAQGNGRPSAGTGRASGNGGPQGGNTRMQGNSGMQGGSARTAGSAGAQGGSSRAAGNGGMQAGNSRAAGNSGMQGGNSRAAGNSGMQGGNSRAAGNGGMQGGNSRAAGNGGMQGGNCGMQGGNSRAAGNGGMQDGNVRQSGNSVPQGGTARNAGNGAPQGSLGNGSRNAGNGQTQGGMRQAGAAGNGNGRARQEGGRPDGGNPVQGGMSRTTGRPSGNGQPQGGAGRSSGTSGYEPRRQTLQGASLQIGDGGSGSGGMGGRKPQDAANRAAASRSAAQAAKKKKIRRIIVMAVAEVLTLICIGFYGYALRLNSSLIHSNDFDKSKVKNTELPVAKTEHMQGYMTIAVFGVDSRDGNVHKGTNTDVIMLCNINRDTGEIKLVSVFRDTYLNTSSGGTYNKINSAYANGGAEQALAALNRNLDLNIEDYVTFNWKSVADGINMLGGIDGIDISKAEFRYINSFITETVQKTGVPSTQLKSAGVQHLDGIQAVAYGRLRLMDTDYARTERQRLVIQKAFEKAKQADLGLLNRILLMEVEQVETSLSFSDLTSLILDIGKYHIGETGGFPFARDSMIMGKKGDCVIPQTLESNVTELHKFLYGEEGYQTTDLVKKISAKISADSGMYKKGVSVDHVPTDQGYVPKETKETDETKKTTKESDEIDERESTSEGTSIEETDENGDPIKPTKPGETTADGTKPTKPGETTADGTKPTKPGETTADGTKPTSSTKPGETTADGTKPTSPTKPGETTSAVKPSSPGDETTESSDSSTGPGVKPTTAPHESTSAPETTSPGPGGSAGPGGGGTVQPGGSGNDDVITVPPPNAA